MNLPRQINRPFFGRSISALVAFMFHAVLLAETTKPEPEISLTVRGAEDGQVISGVPLLVAVRLTADEPLDLSPETGTWADAVTVTIMRDGGAVVAEATAVGKPERPTGSLGNGQVAGGLWRFSAEAMAGLSPGAYQLSARIELTSGSGWTGRVTTEPAELQVLATQADGATAARRVQQFVYDALATDRLEEAAKQIDAELSGRKTDPLLWALRGVVAERAGNPLAASLCLNRALAAGEEALGASAFIVNGLRSRLAALRAEARPSSPSIPDWSWPPLALLSVPPPADNAPLK